MLSGLLAQALVSGAAAFQAESVVPGLLAVTGGGGGRKIKPEAGLNCMVSFLEAVDARPACVGAPTVLVATGGAVRMLNAGLVGGASPAGRGGHSMSAGKDHGTAGDGGLWLYVALSAPKCVAIAAESAGG